MPSCRACQGAVPRSSDAASHAPIADVASRLIRLRRRGGKACAVSTDEDVRNTSSSKREAQAALVTAGCKSTRRTHPHQSNQVSPMRPGSGLPVRARVFLQRRISRLSKSSLPTNVGAASRSLNAQSRAKESSYRQPGTSVPGRLWGVAEPRAVILHQMNTDSVKRRPDRSGMILRAQL